MLHKAMIKDIAQRQAKLWDKTYRDSLRFLGTEGMLVPKDKRGMIAPSSVIIDSHLRIKADKPRKLSPNIRKGLDLVTSIVPQTSSLPGWACKSSKTTVSALSNWTEILKYPTSTPRLSSLTSWPMPSNFPTLTFSVNPQLSCTTAGRGCLQILIQT